MRAVTLYQFVISHNFTTFGSHSFLLKSSLETHNGEKVVWNIG